MARLRWVPVWKRPKPNKWKIGLSQTLNCCFQSCVCSLHHSPTHRLVVVETSGAMAEDLLDLAGLHSAPAQTPATALPSTPVAPSAVPRAGTPSTSSSMNDILSLNSTAATNSPSIPRFEVSPPEPSPLLPRPSASPAPTVSTGSSPQSVVSSGASTGSAMSQLQELWYPQMAQSPSKENLAASPAPAANPSTERKNVLPPVMSVFSGPTEPATTASQAAPAAFKPAPSDNTLSASYARGPVSGTSNAADLAPHTNVEASPAQKQPATGSSVPVLAASSTAAQVSPPFALWSPEGTQEAPAPASHSLASSQSKYSVTTVASPPGSVEQETLTVMKEMVKTMSDMNRRILTLEERVSRLEMEKEILSRTVNRLQETQHQQAVRHDVPKPVVPAANQAGWPPGYPPMYGTINTTYAQVPPSYGQPQMQPTLRR